MENQTLRLTRKEKIAQGIPKPLSGNRKANYAAGLKEAKKTVFQAVLRSHHSSPQKMRLLADQVRGKNCAHALGILSISNRAAARPLASLIKSAVANLNDKLKIDTDPQDLIISTVFVDGAEVFKRVRPAPQGRAYRVRKRSCHVTVRLSESITDEVAS